MLKSLFFNMAPLFRIVPLRQLIRLSGQKNIFPVYHAVSDQDIIHIKHLYTVRNLKQFESDLDFFLKHYPVIDPGDLRTGNGWSKPDKPGFLLTFDDGLSQFNDEIAPLLLKKGLPALCFLNSDFIDNRDLFYRYKASILIESIRQKPLDKHICRIADKFGLECKDPVAFISGISYAERRVLDNIAGYIGIDFNEYLQNCRPYLTKDQVSSLIKKGFVFGAHSIDHPLFSGLSLKQQLWQTKVSLDHIEELFQQDGRFFAFPFTDYGVPDTFFETVFDSDNPVADLTFGCAGLKIDSCAGNIQRIPLEEGTFRAADIIYGEYMYYLAKSLVNKNKIRR